MADAAERVTFDFEGSLQLARKLWALGEALETDSGTRDTDAVTAKEKWEGKYGTEFVGRRDGERTKESNAAQQLKSEANDWAKAWAGALEQQNKNNRAARVNELAEEKKDDRSMWEKGTDGLGFTDETSLEDAQNEVPAAPTVPVPQPPGFAPTATEKTY